ncbi:uncharacterized protein BJ212DRAFT_1302444 [Suillus subaureus]|uniref:Uncharacterized protein n=1 Tax=Suillus subaureus TaxID=48587 RepID=A0A9P7J989_9AGAM|nr:uncharacterized protein BJ212DRAFT_1302444 [Suillus subaureus]KAG1809597.1 hypothetical protein BJ212DRAFT_1302444 [Suillus subaureus]
MFCNEQVALAVQWYMKQTSKLAIMLREMFKVAYLDDFEIYQKAFKAGIWEVADLGPWPGHAIAWKLNVLPHYNRLDGSPMVIFCLSHFSGGEAYLTDLKFKLQAGDLYHAVGSWKAEGGITTWGMPGCIGNESWLDETYCWRCLTQL